MIRLAFLVDQRRRDRLQRQLADVLPQPQQVFEVALDLGLGALGAGGAEDDAHALRHVEVGDDFLQALAVGGVVILREMPPPRAVLGISTQ